MTETITTTKLPLTSPDIAAERLAALRDLYPEIFREGKVDPDALRQALGDAVDTGPERYGLSWAGKADALRNILTPSIGTLIPNRAESVDFDTTDNLFIEGDNLEALKLLQKGYYGQVKMIYIDPPYNTGNDFIYPDNYTEGLDSYLRYSGQVTGEGVKVSTNTETSGRYHSRWLDMLYPRLFLARNLLSGEGVIFVSIDDHEVYNLRLLMNEVFGEENFIATVVWQKSYAPRNNAPAFSESHEFILCYARDANLAKISRLAATEEQLARYTNRDGDARGDWKPGDLSVSLTSGQRGRTFQRTGRGANLYEVTSPSGRVYRPPVGRSWVYSRQKFDELSLDSRIWWGEAGNGMPALKRFLGEIEGGQVAETIWPYTEVGHSQEASKELRSLFSEMEGVAFPTPKPVRLMTRMLQLVSSAKENDIILDFFSGSGSTAQAVLQMNREDGGNRRFIMVQLPEPTGNPALPTIADIGKERIRRVITKMKSESATKLPLNGQQGVDLGFRVFKLAESNFHVWDSAAVAGDPAQLALQLDRHVDHIRPGVAPEGILYEILLKSGFPLTAPVEELTVAGAPCFAVAGGLLLVCLAEKVTAATVAALLSRKPQQIVCLDAAFGGNDQLKTNTVLQLRDAAIAFHTV